ncbi:phosphatase [Heyndrickxia shackletonii]|uniref:Phosphatase n=1 Tax=Heyndrickxia shackletonii TaxID=157838 RepID=A0A0Q3TMP3_9BACI|nr:Cof-type HAD-IIB family hydrolase [Heyndrickxia shackletonii]KQL55001.1 phosphatase [Heyndrickxia shackletonii]MBB2479753.1 Cof-type HAD-IIB family hydrolase [Bacillus sp. APMAM]NEZ01497.1 Cof-type HAD-IIB family hydrolase [Heyndrickxia shackletonii]RTZ56014.1 Cof-type HAD-IIB family hydrolase [Bacillus sp. SAJ1]
MSQRPHLIALDLDGTLLTDDKNISERNARTINKLQEQGHIVMISTGRPFRSSKRYYQELNLKSPIVNFNGAFVHHPLEADWGMYHQPIGIDIAKDIVDTCHQYNIHNIIAEVLDHVYLHYHDEKLLEIFHYESPKVTTGNLLSFLQDNPTSLLIHAEEKDVPKIRATLSDVHAEVIDHRRWGAPWHIIEIVKYGLSKANGIERVANYYNIPKENIIAFGDEDNDFEMIEYAGIGVAMGNAIKPLKDLANHVTASNMEDGVSVFLEEFFKLK